MDVKVYIGLTPYGSLATNIVSLELSNNANAKTPSNNCNV